MPLAVCPAKTAVVERAARIQPQARRARRKKIKVPGFYLGDSAITEALRQIQLCLGQLAQLHADFAAALGMLRTLLREVGDLGDLPTDLVDDHRLLFNHGSHLRTHPVDPVNFLGNVLKGLLHVLDIGA